MALKVTVSSGKTETPRTSAGLIHRTSSDSSPEAVTGISIAELVSAVFQEVRSSLGEEAEIEMEITANIEITVKDGVQALNLDISGESSNTRTMRLKFNTKANPPEAGQ